MRQSRRAGLWPSAGRWAVVALLAWGAAAALPGVAAPLAPVLPAAALGLALVVVALLLVSLLLWRYQVAARIRRRRLQALVGRTGSVRAVPPDDPFAGELAQALRQARSRRK